MYIRVDESNNIIQVVAVGGKPDGISYELDTIDRDILTNIFEYKYIDGQFIRKENPRAGKLNIIRTTKIQNMSSICRSLIENGIDFNNEHYSLTETDQINLMKLSSTASLNPTAIIFYHADGNLCRQYETNEILQLSQLAEQWITYHTTYFNFLKAQINNMTDVDAIIAINYGDKLEEQYQEQISNIIKDSSLPIDNIVQDTYNYEGFFPKLDADSMLKNAEQYKQFIKSLEELESADNNNTTENNTTPENNITDNTTPDSNIPDTNTPNSDITDTDIPDNNTPIE